MHPFPGCGARPGARRLSPEREYAPHSLPEVEETMPAKSELPIIHELRCELRKVNAIMTFVVYCIFFLLLKFLYDTLIELSASSIETILSIVAFIIVCSMFLIRSLSTKAIRNISDSAAKCNILLKFSKDIRTEEAYTDTMLGKILEYAMSLIRIDTGLVLLRDGETFVVTACRGGQAELFSGRSFSGEDAVFSRLLAGEGIVRIGQGTDTGRVLPRLGPEVSSLLAAPLRGGSGVMGAILLINKQERTFSGDDEAAISYFSDHAAVSLENARFHEEQKNFEIHVTELLLQAMDSHLPVKRERLETVARYSNLIAIGIDLPFEKRKVLHTACLLHDIGYIRLPVTVNPDEALLMHVMEGFSLLKSITCFRNVAPIVLHHQEWYDGSGIPGRLKGEAIPLESRIIAIAEAFDNHVTERFYRTPVAYDDVFREMAAGSGTRYDPDLLAVFLREVRGVLPER